MGRISTRSNPTGLKEIDKRRVAILVTSIEGRRFFNLIRLDLNDMGLNLDDRVICVARAGKTSQRFDMGTVADWRRENLALDDLDLSELLRFRILIHSQDQPKLLASAENLRPLDESQSESLLPMEPADLGQLLWRLDIDDEGPVLKFNSSVFPSGAGVENYLPFAALVLPEAVRRVMESITKEPERLNDDSDPLSRWSAWLDSLGVNSLGSETDEGEKKEWCEHVIESFCTRHSFATRLALTLSLGGTDRDGS